MTIEQEWVNIEGASEPERVIGTRDRLHFRVLVRTILPLAAFLGYAGVVWFGPVPVPSPVAAEGGNVHRADRESILAWRSAGCQFCHSIYGLGGHTGPDLANVVSRESPAYVRAMMIAGPRGMPTYGHLDETALAGIIRYLEAVDGSGRYPSATWLGSSSGGE